MSEPCNTLDFRLQMVRMFVIACVLIGPASAQPERPSSPPDPDVTSQGGTVWQVGPWFGAARQSPITPLLGTTPGRDHLFLGIQGSRQIRRVGALSLAYQVQVLPVVAISGRTAPRHYPGLRGPDGLLPGSSLAYAAGFSPLGLELATPEAGRLSAFAASAVGALVFSRPVPVQEARRFNFTMEIGAGARLRTRPGQWVQLGYKFHHLSNGYTADMNPGLDGHVFYTGYQWSVRLPWPKTFGQDRTAVR